LTHSETIMFFSSSDSLLQKIYRMMAEWIQILEKNMITRVIITFLRFSASTFQHQCFNRRLVSTWVAMPFEESPKAAEQAEDPGFSKDMLWHWFSHFFPHKIHFQTHSCWWLSVTSGLGQPFWGILRRGNVVFPLTGWSFSVVFPYIPSPVCDGNRTSLAPVDVQQTINIKWYMYVYVCITMYIYMYIYIYAFCYIITAHKEIYMLDPQVLHPSPMNFRFRHLARMILKSMQFMPRTARRCNCWRRGTGAMEKIWGNDGNMGI
jgi:hypothetical protein